MFSGLNRLLMSRGGPAITGAVVGILAPVLSFLGNPANMGICVACFGRDIAGALGMHEGRGGAVHRGRNSPGSSSDHSSLPSCTRSSSPERVPPRSSVSSSACSP